MKLQMIAKFRLYVDREITSTSVGGFNFKINGMDIPFDFDAGGANKDDKTGVWTYESGYGCFFNDFELSDCYDDEYAELGLKREDITAQFLASATEIGEFYIDYTDADGNDHAVCVEAENGSCVLELISIEFVERDTTNLYSVQREVINAHNEQYINGAEELIKKMVNSEYSKFRAEMLCRSVEEVFDSAYCIRFYKEINSFADNGEFDSCDLPVGGLYFLLSLGKTIISTLYDAFVVDAGASIETNTDVADFVSRFVTDELRPKW